ncbi:MAG: TolC family protein [Bacteroidaceae bacterium]|nr:TolC family protein [Bacteroidaceae bacterium]
MLNRIQILTILCLPLTLHAQTEKYALTLQEAAGIMNASNPTIQIAEKAVSMMQGEKQKLNAFWYPMLNTSGMYVHLSDKVEVKQPLNTYTEPAKEFVQSILPDDKLITSILDQVGSYTLSVPILQRNLTTIDANISWPVFTGGKRMYASRIGNRMVDIAQVGQEETNALLQTELIQTYYALQLADKVQEVREQTYRSLQQHYNHALKLEANGMITKAERLFAEVNRQEAKREWEASQKEREVAHQALCSLLNIQKDADIQPISQLFVTDELPDSLYFKNMIPMSNYTISKLNLEESIADNNLSISKSAYFPTIALFGKQTLYAHNLPRNLMPRTLIGIGFTWNLFDGLNREADIRVSRLAKETIGLEKEKAKNTLDVMVQEIYSQLQKAQDEVNTLQTTIAMSEELLRIRRKSFEEGMATSTEVVDAEVMLSKVRIAMLLAYYQFDVSLASLCSVCGVPELFWKLMEES